MTALLLIILICNMLVHVRYLTKVQRWPRLLKGSIDLFDTRHLNSLIAILHRTIKIIRAKWIKPLQARIASYLNPSLDLIEHLFMLLEVFSRATAAIKLLPLIHFGRGIFPNHILLGFIYQFFTHEGLNLSLMYLYIFVVTYRIISLRDDLESRGVFENGNYLLGLLDAYLPLHTGNAKTRIFRNWELDGEFLSLYILLVYVLIIMWVWLLDGHLIQARTIILVWTINYRMRVPKQYWGAAFVFRIVRILIWIIIIQGKLWAAHRVI